MDSLKEHIPRSSDGEESDADSDYEDLQGDIAKFDKSVRDFLTSHHGSGDGPSVTRGGVRGRGARGPRKAAKPRGDITARIARVNQAFLAGEYDQALDLAFEVIRINAEIHQAWTALASIFREIGERDRSLSAMVYAAHLRPKDVTGWLRCAAFAIETAVGSDSRNLHTARLCFSAASRADPTNIEARISKANICEQQGHHGVAILEYNQVLRYHPYELDVIRKLAETSIDSRHVASAIPSSIAAYQKYFDYKICGSEDEATDQLWHDVTVYAELLALSDRHLDAIRELKKLARWLLGRPAQTYWDRYQHDDREWDVDNDRRQSVDEFDCSNEDVSKFGLSLPLDLRALLAKYRLKLGHDEEAMNHLKYLETMGSHTFTFAVDSPYSIFDLGVELLEHGKPSLAKSYFDLIRSAHEGPDAAVLLNIGRCQLALGEQQLAEELFLEALDAEEDNIDARVELANMYEKAREEEEAFILAAEAMALRGAQDQDQSDPRDRSSRRAGSADVAPPRPERRRTRRPNSTQAQKRSFIPKRYRPKRLVGPDQRLRDDKERAIKLTRQFNFVVDLKRQISDGRNDLLPEWMALSRDLIDEFRSLKRFYSWDKYLRFLGSNDSITQQAHGEREIVDPKLSEMYERLTRSVAPQADSSNQASASTGPRAHQGISFDDWLNLFLDYAISLAIDHKRQDAYQVCEAARDSSAFQSLNSTFIIYVTWSVCAIYANDEETCVAVARHLMRDGAITDSYRLFALLSRLCQSPISWYTSGPAQKYILRQIKAIDASHGAGLKTQDISSGGQNQNEPSSFSIDVCLLMLYGHILFTSTSYAFALGYFLRARSIDPNNSMVNLSLGLAYVHYALKRQAANRQYLLLQGQAFLFQYAEIPSDSDDLSAAERCYNVGRLFHLLGINSLSTQYYTRALGICKGRGGSKDLASLIAANLVTSYMSVGNNGMALAVLKSNLRL